MSMWALFFSSERKRVALLPPQERILAWDRFVENGRLDDARGPILQHFIDAINALDKRLVCLKAPDGLLPHHSGASHDQPVFPGQTL